MIFVLDENFPGAALSLLTKYGHTGHSVLEFTATGTDDLKVFDVAQTQQAVLVTTDKDFYHTIPLLFSEHHGVVVIALHQPNREKLLRRPEWAMRWMKQGDIRGRVLLVTDQQHVLA
jgi:predicted nuclease of predicted toxin-antitoxin system